MLGDFARLAFGEATLHVRGWVAGAGLIIVTAACFAVAIGFGTAAAYIALLPELGSAWTAALIAGVYMGIALIALAASTVARRRRVARQLAVARSRAAVTPTMGPEMMLLAAAAGALFSLGGNRRSR